MEDKIRAIIRIRPTRLTQDAADESAKPALVKQNSKTVCIESKSKKYGFEHVFDYSDTSSDLFDASVKDVVIKSLEGYNVCIFAYGQTSSGKTYTMKGTQTDPGVIPRSQSEIYNKIEKLTKEKTITTIKISFIEIYNEMIRDLLNPSNENLKLQIDKDSNLKIEDLTETSAPTIEDAIDLFENGENQRKFDKTKMNDRSSRSHVIFKIQQEVENQDDDFLYNSTINLIDLAGSEGVAKADTEGKRLKEGSSINKSLLAMYNVITKLNSGNGFVSFRESKLTRILQPYLGGNCQTSIICACSPDKSNIQESLNTLRFAMCAGGIKNDVKKNIQKRDRTAELEMLKEALIIEENKRNALKLDIDSQKATINEEESKLENVDINLAELENVYKDIIEEELGLDNDYNSFKSKVENISEDNNKMSENIEELKKALEVLDDYDSRAMNDMRNSINNELLDIEQKNTRLINRNNILKQKISEINEELREKDFAVNEGRMINQNLNENTTYLTKSISKSKNSKAIEARNNYLIKKKKSIKHYIELLTKDKEILDLLFVIEKSKIEIFKKEHLQNNLKLKVYDSKNILEMSKKLEEKRVNLEESINLMPQNQNVLAPNINLNNKNIGFQNDKKLKEHEFIDADCEFSILSGNHIDLSKIKTPMKAVSVRSEKYFKNKNMNNIEVFSTRDDFPKSQKKLTTQISDENAYNITPIKSILPINSSNPNNFVSKEKYSFMEKSGNDDINLGKRNYSNLTKPFKESKITNAKTSVSKGTFFQYGHVEKKVKLNLSNDELLKDLVKNKKKAYTLECQLKKRGNWEHKINHQLMNMTTTSKEISKVITGFENKLEGLRS